MKFVETPDYNNPGLYNIDDVGLTMLYVYGTPQLKEAAISGYRNFKVSEVKRRIRKILQLQLYMLYRWSLIRYLLLHNIKGNFIRQKMFDVTPDSFYPENGDVELYFLKPMFLWRFSKANYKFMCLLFTRKINKEIQIFLENYTVDSSAMLSYVEIKATVFSKSVPQKIDNVEKYFKYQMNAYEMTEIYYSNDFFLHLMDPETSYTEFTKLILVGYCERYQGDLYTKKQANKDKEMFQFADNHYMGAESVINHFAELIKSRKAEIDIKNTLFVNPEWNGISDSIGQFYSFSFAFLADQIFDDQLKSSQFRFIDAVGNVVRQGSKLPCSDSRSQWLVLKYFTLTMEYPWINSYLISTKFKNFRDISRLLQGNIQTLKQQYMKLNDEYLDYEIKLLNDEIESYGHALFEHNSERSSVNTPVTSVFDTTFHRNRKNFDKGKTLHPNILENVSDVWLENVVITERKVSSNISCGPQLLDVFDSKTPLKQVRLIESPIYLGIMKSELNSFDLSWTLYDEHTGMVKPFNKVHSVINELMVSTLKAIGSTVEFEAQKYGVKSIDSVNQIFPVFTESEKLDDYIVKYLTSKDMQILRQELDALENNIVKIKQQILTKSEDHREFVYNFVKYLQLGEVFNTVHELIALEVSDEDREYGEFATISTYDFPVLIEEFIDLIDSFENDNEINICWQLKSNGFIDITSL